MKKLLLIILCLPILVLAQQTYVPDDNFEAYLEANGMGNGIANDDSVYTSAIDIVTNLYVGSQNISDLTGIEDFIALEFLMCSDNQITNLDLSNNIYLSTLFCNNNHLSYLNLKNGNNTSIPINNVSNCLSIINNPLLYCIEVDNISFSNNNWFGAIDTQHYFSTNCPPPSAIKDHKTNKEILKITDLLGRETKKTNQPLLYIYDDGTIEKRIVIE